MPTLLDSLSRRDDAPAPRRRVPAWLIPLTIVACFLLIFLALFRDRLLPARDVDVAVVLAAPATDGAPASVSTSAGTLPMLFQASGWIEPDPLPVKASSLIDGVVATVDVLEGEIVGKGQLLATLVDEDARLAQRSAESEHKRRISALAAHEAAISKVRKKLDSARSAVDAAQATSARSGDQHERATRLSIGAISEGEVTTARLNFARDKAMAAMADAGVGEIEADITRLDLETTVKRDEVDAAAIEMEKSKLELDRTRIISPMRGRVLRLMAIPGQKRMLGADHEDSTTIAILYDPEKLQVRVDVPLADAAGLKVGQPVRIHCGLLPDRVFSGEVTRIAGEADLQRNTLQAKVRILDPVDELRPEMLCRAEFLATPDNGNTGSNNIASSTLSTWIPESAILDGTAWVCDPPTKRVSPRPIEPGTDIRDGYRRVTGTLRPGEWVVLAPQDLGDGQRVNPNLIEP